MNKIVLAALAAISSFILTACGGGGEVVIGSNGDAQIIVPIGQTDTRQSRPVVVTTSFRTLGGFGQLIGSVQELARYQIYCPRENTVTCDYVGTTIASNGAVPGELRSGIGRVYTPAHLNGAQTYFINEALRPGETREYVLYGTVQNATILVDMLVMSFTLGGVNVSPTLAPAAGACGWFIKPSDCPI